MRTSTVYNGYVICYGHMAGLWWVTKNGVCIYSANTEAKCKEAIDALSS